METLTERLVARGWRMTPQRRVISRLFDISADQHVHLTAEDVLERSLTDLPDISRATVYNMLGELVEAGEILAVNVGDRITRYDPNVQSAHHHLVCNGCGSIFDVPIQSAVAEYPKDTSDGFVIESAEVIYRGRCADCVAKAAPAS